jgi:Helix-hairpin-helix motif
MLDPPRPWWVLWSVIPFGWLTWVGLVYAGARARMPLMIGVAVLFLASTVAAFATSDGDTSGAISVIGYVAGVGAVLGFAPFWQRRMRRLAEPAPIDRAKARLEAREQAMELARADPTLAREVGVGRPDVPGAQHGDVVDVNMAPHSVLAQLPGIDDATAREIVRLREELDGFTSLMDLGSTIDLPADTVDDLRGRVVFIPR